MQLHLVLDDESLALVVDLLGKLGRDGVMLGGILHHQAHVAFNALQDMGLLSGPDSIIHPLDVILPVLLLGLLLGMRSQPSRVPAFCKLLEEWSFES